MPKIEYIQEEDLKEGTKRIDLTLDDLDSSNYLSLGIGEYQEITIKRITKIVGYDKKFCLSGTDYKLEIETTDGQLLSVNSWALWNELKAALKKAGKIEGCKVKIMHPSEGVYKVVVIE